MGGYVGELDARGDRAEKDTKRFAWGKEDSTHLYAKKRVFRFVAILCVDRLYGFCFLPRFLDYYDFIPN